MSYSILVFLISFTLLARAEVYELDVIEVVAEKDISRYNFAPSNQVPEKELNATPMGLMTEKLKEVPGMVSNQNGGPGGRVSYFIRGTESRHVAFTLDGLKLNDPSNTDRQFDSAFFTAPILRDLDIHKGPQAVLYGSDAFGGLVEMTTRKGEHAPETRVNFNGGSFGTFSSAISDDWQSGANRGTVTGQRFHSDGISRLNKKRYDATEKDSSDITQLTSSSIHQWSSKGQTNLLGSFLRGENELDGAIDDNSNDESTNDQYLLQQKTRYRTSKQLALSLRNGINRHQRFLDTLAVGKESYEGDLFQNEFLADYQAKRLSLLGGLSAEREKFEIPSVDKKFDLHSTFLQSALDVNPVKFQMGLRAERHSRYGSFYTGNAGVSIQVDGLFFSAQYSQGYKAPSLYQLYGPPLFGFPVGNKKLVPEVNHAWEGNALWLKDDFETWLTLFQNRLSNLITFTNTQGYINQDRFIAEGVEWGGKFRQERYQLSAGYTYQQFREEEKVVLRRPYNNLMGAIAFFPTDVSELSLKGRWYSSRKDVNDGGETVKLNGVEVFDLGAMYDFKVCRVGLEFLNILNREYEELFGYSVMPRSVFGQVDFKF